ncbi:MAG TPA: hypothetical protein PLQ45_07780 [Anaerohalosphaeraceae bacterium]|jgi:hypothetical protein|nr:hypothetical protein [Anaerohalosphaeraceae bacterium]
MRKIAAVMLLSVLSGLAFGQAGVIVPCGAQLVLPTPETSMLICSGVAFFSFLKK